MKLRFFLFFLSFVVLLGSAFSAYEFQEFTKYHTTVTLFENDTMQVEKVISMRNIYERGIIPGQVEFKILDEHQSMELLDFKAYNRYGQEIKSYVRDTQDFKVLGVDIFTPLLPGFEYEMTLRYTLSIEPSGLFFKTLTIPLKENTNLPILDGSLLIQVPEGKTYTYYSYEDNSTDISDNAIFWKFNEQTDPVVKIEYSNLPITIPGIQGSLIFWFFVNMILLIVLIREVKKELKRHR